jgi:hypothetical protein
VNEREILRRGAVPILVVLVVGLVAACSDEPGDGLRKPFHDSGPASTVAEVKAALPGLLQGPDAAGRLDPVTFTSTSSAAKERANLSAAAVRERRAVIEASVVPEQVDSTLETVEEGVREMLDDPEWLDAWGYTSNSFTVERFEGVRVDGDAAQALLVGERAYSTPTGPMGGDKRSQYLVRLVRLDAGWRVKDTTSRFLPGYEP